MALKRLNFSKSWTDPTDFPTVETDETIIRQDMQQLHDETKTYLNDTLLPQIEEGYAPAGRAVNGHPLTADVTVTKEDVGLGRVDDTADMDKPVSTAQAAAIQAVAMGQIPEGSVEKTMLAADVAAAVGRAEAGGGLDQKIAETAAQKAALLHASQHGASGSDPITPEAIGAVSKTGDTMTGSLNVVGGYCSFSGDSNSLLLYHLKNGDRHGFVVYPNLELNYRFQVFDEINGQLAQYRLLHDGNLEGAGVSRSRSITYTGTGTTGVSVAVGFVPRLVVVQEVVSATGAPSTFPLVLTNTGVSLGLYRSSGGDLSGFKVTVTAFGETVSWECSSRAEANNISGSTYRVIAVG